MRDLEDTMIAANGVGLAAPQIGKPLRVIVVQAGESVLALANPELVRGSGESVDEEGCLSMPLFFGMVPRYAEVTVRGLDSRGKQLRRKADGLLARALQHELDHLNGLLFKDKLAAGSELRFAGGVPAESREKAST